MASPGWRILLNLPMRSTIQAVCWGTKRMMVLAGREGFWKYEVVRPGPPGPDMPNIEGLGAPCVADWEKLRGVEEEEGELRRLWWAARLLREVCCEAYD